MRSRKSRCPPTRLMTSNSCPNGPCRISPAPIRCTLINGGCRTAVGVLPDALKTPIYPANVTQESAIDQRGTLRRGFPDRRRTRRPFRRQLSMPAGVSNSTSWASSQPTTPTTPGALGRMVERLTANTALVIGGTVAATLTASDSEISGLLFGAFYVAEKATHPLTQFPIQCTGIHDFVCGADEGTCNGADAYRRVQRIVGLSFSGSCGVPHRRGWLAARVVRQGVDADLASSAAAAHFDKSIAFVSDRGGTDRIYLANEDGSVVTPQADPGHAQRIEDLDAHEREGQLARAACLSPVQPESRALSGFFMRDVFWK